MDKRQTHIVTLAQIQVLHRFPLVSVFEKYRTCCGIFVYGTENKQNKFEIFYFISSYLDGASCGVDVLYRYPSYKPFRPSRSYLGNRCNIKGEEGGKVDDVSIGWARIYNR